MAGRQKTDDMRHNSACHAPGLSGIAAGLCLLLTVSGVTISPALANSAAMTGHHSLTVKISGLKDRKGVLQYCITPKGGGFPECSGPGSRSGTIPLTSAQVTFTLGGLPDGEYAVAVFHDRNGNARLDTMLGIPKEGYGFSRNPPFAPRKPRFSECSINLPESPTVEIRLRYLL